ncbi:Uu.00g113860.m01.CDS01 [Anthostomella pinea]|uniref:Uu.00g113860.m01.CDS01 n=1 Tax=Anthostomella pinea TaxID=933095 RepID=A0AAI8YGQ7_9PEZI|nr:Uu.00g113860.m01.CDS01 [Anthostomella pinea]
MSHAADAGRLAEMKTKLTEAQMKAKSAVQLTNSLKTDLAKLQEEHKTQAGVSQADVDDAKAEVTRWEEYTTDAVEEFQQLRQDKEDFEREMNERPLK